MGGLKNQSFLDDLGLVLGGEVQANHGPICCPIKTLKGVLWAVELITLFDSFTKD